ncbi:reverse transcriptase domain-containing protein [Tanacetum coccineum]
MYQRLGDIIFEGQIGRNLEAYVDDMVIKSKTGLEMIKDVEETLLTLKKVNMKLNPKKCSFRIEEDKFLGYIVTFEGIRANSEKAKAVVNMPSPSNLKQMQQLSGKLAALNRFLSKAAKRALPYLDTLKKSPKKEEELMVYLSAANEAVSVVLLVEREGRNQSIILIKGQVLADFLADTMAEDISTQVKTDELNDTLVEGESMEEQEATETKAPKNLRAETDIWKLYTDGASNEHGSGAGLILIDLEGAEYSYARRLNFANSNNDAEYKALLAGPQQAKYLIKEIHMGSCGMHDGPRRAVHKAMSAGYFWPSMHRDANNEISNSDSCQWGMDIVGPLPEAPCKIKYLIVSIDYFTKWLEAKPGEGLGIKLVSTSVYHPQANGAVERANRSIMQGIKTRLHQEGGTWVKELPNVLLAHRTTPKTSNEETPFSLAYGTKAVIPAKIGIPTRRVIQESNERNEEALRLNLNLLEEQREIAEIREAR